MARGQAVPIGSERKAQNGYWYVKCKRRDGTTHWRLKHHLIFEEHHGRALKDEQVRFQDGNIENFDPDNIIAVPLGKSSIRRRLAQLTARRDDIQGMIDYYNKLLEDGDKK